MGTRSRAHPLRSTAAERTILTASWTCCCAQFRGERTSAVVATADRCEQFVHDGETLRVKKAAGGSGRGSDIERSAGMPKEGEQSLSQRGIEGHDQSRAGGLSSGHGPRGPALPLSMLRPAATLPSCVLPLWAAHERSFAWDFSLPISDSCQPGRALHSSISPRFKTRRFPCSTSDR